MNEEPAKTEHVEETVTETDKPAQHETVTERETDTQTDPRQDKAE